MSVLTVMTHPELPGIQAYFFDDGTVVVADPTGRESPPQPYSEADFTELGWEPQEDAITQLTGIARDLLFEAIQQLPPPRTDKRT
jgi:hypothetical protein